MGFATLVPVPVSSSHDGGGTPVWLSLLLALIPLSGAVLAAVLVRRTDRETVRVSQEELANSVLSRVDARLGDLELDRWRRREETMRMLRWAAEQAATDDTWTVGLATLRALGTSELLQPEDRGIITAVLEALLARPRATTAAHAVPDRPSPVTPKEQAAARLLVELQELWDVQVADATRAVAAAPTADLGPPSTSTGPAGPQPLA
ncbi:hypothetical protein CLV35_3087 [Motilibacter peucedani]|uniref:Uncharacterized protein n=1 Tax=Motilibacter peucedani TaxID=598650 RepID=A0A420XLV4_9ACTN|nr:hypothetical protein [Motilibacter peucedani]RKS71291.1 hypothetical protein CLV35_3087 [Motilibacter peucedani]